MSAELQARYLGPTGRRLFVVTWRPKSATTRCVLFVPPFGDEMNKSRHLLAEVGRGLAVRGICAVLCDFYGTGDSDGEFGQATWDLWMDNLHSVAADLTEQGMAIEALLCVRTGALLGCAAAHAASWPVQRMILWQPVTQGSRYLTQFLRMRVAASLGEKNAQTTTDLKTRLAQGDTLEVGGYDISPALARQLESAELLPWLDGSRSQLLWLDVVPHGDTELAPATSDFVRQARSKGVRVVAVAIAAEPFWMSAELVRVPALVARTVSAIVTPP